MTATPFVSKVLEQGKITIPKHVRELFDLRQGDTIVLLFETKIRSPNPRETLDFHQETPPPTKPPEESSTAA